ncbi:MAG: hypothetical protein KatS3mg131_1798 [Candidatus Tectimicrobiota bacterium]|nr:MAG: hypothetical protein KatS3mg131_1798 [Candidatus Tectomicrobia bacterium]
MAVGLVYHPDFLKHDTGPRHPERASRLEAILRALEANGPAVQRLALPEDLDALFWIAQVHHRQHIERVQAACQRAMAALDPDTVVCRDSFAVALRAVAAALAAADAVLGGQVAQAFCAVRPPGHHAEVDRAMGFCLFNTVAILARYLQRRHGLENILIVDWDVHHGNGTQHIFEEDPSVFYFSVHQYPWYPGTGAATETGVGRGKGYTLNVPLPAGSGDDVYREVFLHRLRATCPGLPPRLRAHLGRLRRPRRRSPGADAGHRGRLSLHDPGGARNRRGLLPAAHHLRARRRIPPGSPGAQRRRAP